MRVTILILSGAVVLLAASIVNFVQAREEEGPRLGPLMNLDHMIANARASEEVEYREATSYRQMHFRVEQAPHLPPFATPWKFIRRVLKDARSRTYENAATGVGYRHDVGTHGWFPLMAPQAPDALDRVWVIRAIHQDKITVMSREWDCWRVDCIDPALPDGKDTVVVWMHEQIPVYGILKWKRAGETWEATRGAWAPK
jgi:hypothetical protein